MNLYIIRWHTLWFYC